ncbi:hypothetical protein F4779DRAFT_574318 [Xylariaceae sp. FL0662B]|nr:hypothetical protein F4779DRAFT_574318 [Xylariaceae sp. FL0662B]
MDAGDTWIMDALQGFLPEQTLQLLHDHVLDPQTPIQVMKRHLISFSQSVLSALRPMVYPLIERGMQALQDSPDLVVLAFLLAAMVLVLQVVLWVHRTMMFFTRLAVRAVGWAIVAGLLAVVWQRGPEATIRDVVVFVSKVVGYAAVVKDIWLSEYQKYDAQTKGGQRAPTYNGSRRTGR